MLDDLDQKHAVGDGQVICLLSRYRVKAHISPKVLIKPVDRIDAVKLRGLPGVPYLTKQISAPAADIEPAKMWLRIRGREGALYDFLD